MGRKLFTTIFFLALLFIAVIPVHGADKVAGSSASLIAASGGDSSAVAKNRAYMTKKEAIRRVLARSNSPMIESADSFIEACRTYDLDCYLLPAIAGLESGYGHHTAPGSYNPFGWGGGRILFINWGDGIDTVGRGLRNNYIDRGAGSIEAIGAIYAASPTWAVRIHNFMAQFKAEEEKIQLFLPENTI